MKNIILAMVCLFIMAGTAHADFNIEWDAPTTNADGSPLTDLAGYKVYYGTESGNYSDSIDVGNVTDHTITLPPGAYHIIVIAYDTSGNESGHSNELYKDVMAPRKVTIRFKVE